MQLTISPYKVTIIVYIFRYNENRVKAVHVLMKKLTEENLKQPLDEVFELGQILGKGSYGYVHKAIHKQSGKAFAIKQVTI